MLEIGSADELMPMLVAHRKVEGLRQKDVAQKMGVGQPAVSELESGNTAPKLDTVQKYAEAVGYRLTYTLWEGTDNGNGNTEHE